LTSVSKNMPQQSEWQDQKGVSNEEPPLEGKRSSFYLWIFRDFLSRDTTQMYLQIIAIFCHIQLQTIPYMLRRCIHSTLQNI
jgi:hypothetical protein